MLLLHEHTWPGASRGVINAVYVTVCQSDCQESNDSINAKVVVRRDTCAGAILPS